MISQTLLVETGQTVIEKMVKILHVGKQMVLKIFHSDMTITSFKLNLIIFKLELYLN